MGFTCSFVLKDQDDQRINYKPLNKIIMTLIRTKRQNGNAIPSHRSDLLDLFETHPFFPETLLSQPILNWNGNSPRIPATNVRETQDEYRVELAAPGMRKE